LGYYKERSRYNTSRVEVNTLKIFSKKLNNQQDIAGEFNKYFANVAEKIIRQANMNSITTNNLKNEENYTYLMGQAFSNSYPNIKCNCSTKKK
jgi:hypothetical protein